ncbi:MAG: CoA transferase [Rhodoferax sp.]|nr:CoA transferase [Rhodoferax sp.]
MAGPLTGFRVLEMSGIGPGPFCAMMLADMGAEVVCIDRKTPSMFAGGGSIVDRGRRTVVLDLKSPASVGIVMRLVERSDALIEGMRPGVMERMGLGPVPCLQRNPRLVYGRITGWGQTGPLAQAAGHDLNYIAITGALHAMGHADRPPTPPLHLVGDMGGGAMMLAFGIVSALLEASRSGQGQVVDAAMCDGVSTLSTMYYALLKSGMWSTRREANMLDGGAHFYGSYICADGKFVSIGAIEPRFYATLLQLCGIDDPDFKAQWSQEEWPVLRRKLEDLFKTRSREQWCELLEGTDACFAPVLDFAEATQHPHNVARGTFIETDGVTHPAPAPRFSRTPGVAGSVPKVGQHTLEILNELGYSEMEISALRESSAIV